MEERRFNENDAVLFNTKTLEEYIEGIRNGKLNGFTYDGPPVYEAAILEYPMAYIEVIIHSREQLFGEIGDQTPCINYFCSLTDENGDSYSNDTIDYEPHVNWKAEEWRHQLLIDMHKALQVYAEKDGCILPKLDIRLLQE